MAAAAIRRSSSRQSDPINHLTRIMWRAELLSVNLGLAGKLRGTVAMPQLSWGIIAAAAIISSYWSLTLGIVGLLGLTAWVIPVG